MLATTAFASTLCFICAGCLDDRARDAGHRQQSLGSASLANVHRRASHNVRRASTRSRVQRHHISSPTRKWKDRKATLHAAFDRVPHGSDAQRRVAHAWARRELQAILPSAIPHRLSLTCKAQACLARLRLREDDFRAFTPKLLSGAPFQRCAVNVTASPRDAARLRQVLVLLRCRALKTPPK